MLVKKSKVFIIDYFDFKLIIAEFFINLDCYYFKQFKAKIY